MSLHSAERAAVPDPLPASARRPDVVRGRVGSLVLALAILFAGAALRIHDVAERSIHSDEIYSIWETRSARKAANSVDVITAWQNRVRMMVHPGAFEPPGIDSDEAWRLRWGYRTNPLCLMINEVAVEALGPTPLAVRLGSLIFGLAALVVLPLMARPMLGDRGALILLAFIAFCPDVVEMSRFARYPAACFLFGGIAALAAARFGRDRRARDEWICLVAIALLTLSHVTALLVGGTLFLYLALVARGRVSLILLPLAAIAALLVWHYGSLGKVGTVIKEGIVNKAHYPWWRLAVAIAYNVGPAMIALAGVAVFALKRSDRRPLIPLLAAATIPTVAFFWMNRRNDIGPRYFGAIEAIGIVLAAFGAEFLFRRERGRLLARAVLALALISQSPLLLSNWIAPQSYPMAEAARTLKEIARPEDRILSNWSGILDYYMEPRKVGELPHGIADLEESLLEGRRPRAFLVLERQRGELAWPGRAGRLEEWLDANARHVERLGVRRVDSFIYNFELDLYEIDVEKLRGRQ